MRAIEHQPVITLVNVPPTEGSILNGKRSVDVYAGLQTPSLGPAVIHGILLKEGYENVNTLDPRFNTKGSPFKVVDSKFTDSDFNLLANSDVIGISSMTRNREVSLRLIEWVELNNPGAWIPIGGPDATFKPELWLAGGKGKRVVVRNEGEKTIVELMQTIKNGESLENVKGISYKKNGQVIHNEKRPLLTERELSDVPLPVFPKNIQENSNVHVIETKRGCPNRCDFCSVTTLYGGTYRIKDTKTIISSIKSGKKGKGVFIVDDNFAHKSRLRETKQGMQAIIDNGLNNRDYGVQLDTVTISSDPEFADLAVKMGVLFIFFGIESPDAEVLKGMHKAATVAQNKAAVEICDEHDIFTQGMEIIGAKYETEKSIEALKRWNKKSRLNSIQVFPIIPIVGSKLAETKQLFPAVEKDTNLISGQYVISLPSDGFTCSSLMQKEFDVYKDFYGNRLYNAISSLRPLRHIFRNPERALKLTLVNIAVKSYARKLLSEIIDSDYTKNYMEYLREIDQEIYEKGKVIFDAKNP